MRADGANRCGQSSAQLERRSVEWMCVDTDAERAADALWHARAGPVEHCAVWRHESPTACNTRRRRRRRAPPITMCELEGLGTQEDTALELEEVSEEP
jgi:hypothetical protein